MCTEKIMSMAVIGMGHMGSRYAEFIAAGQVPGMELSAVTRVHRERLEQLKNVLPEGLPIYQSADDLFMAVDEKKLHIDGVIIVTPHYSHEDIALKAFARGLHVLCDKPAGVYSRQSRNMECARKDELLYGFIFHQRTFPVYKKIRDIVKSGRYGRLKRVNWVMSDWYRPNAYYTSGTWRATWEGDGGGTLLNQCPHNLDLLQWICGMPARTRSFCHEGKYHPIQVEDEVTSYLEWDNGATGVFFATTGEASGINRLEISLDDALLVCDKGGLGIFELDRPEAEYREEKEDLYLKPSGTFREILCEKEREPYVEILKNFAAAFFEGETLTAPGEEARKSLLLSNAMYLSSWENRMIEIPALGSKEELEFEAAFERELEKKQLTNKGEKGETLC
ncbi:MAG: Gfo/Idh/MocA family oxidoreductase [Roseburia sp.]|nr:Gfo/Idh/MocA family oxidoreductase [Roseburia sp.]